MKILIYLTAAASMAFASPLALAQHVDVGPEGVTVGVHHEHDRDHHDVGSVHEHDSDHAHSAVQIEHGHDDHEHLDVHHDHHDEHHEHHDDHPH